MTLLGFAHGRRHAQHRHTESQRAAVCASPAFASRMFTPSPSRLLAFDFAALQPSVRAAQLVSFTNLNPANPMTLPFILIPWGKMVFVLRLIPYLC